MSEKKIVWEKWIDPLNTNIDEVEYPGHDYPSLEEEKSYELFSTDPLFEEKMDEYSDSEEEHHKKNISYNPMRIVSTPHGFVSLTEHSFASKNFDFWTLHYSRDITKKVEEIIEKCEGVESLNVLTRYRARIGFNRPLIQSGVFNLSEIKKNIENSIISSKANHKEKEEIEESSFNREIKDKAKNVIERLSMFKRWSVYVLPNGNIETVVGSDDSGDFEKTKSLFEEAERIVGGMVFSSGKN
tara:strand:+ start:114 stop:839 length:726 start_codon:yes stop_codon:yes gene_type:complete